MKTEEAVTFLSGITFSVNTNVCTISEQSHFLSLQCTFCINRHQTHAVNLNAMHLSARDLSDQWKISFSLLLLQVMLQEEKEKKISDAINLNQIF